MVVRWKGILIVFAGVVLASLAALYVILSCYDFNDLKPEITRRVKAATGRELTTGGDIDLKIGFWPVLAIDNVTLRNAAWGSRPEMARIHHFEVQVALLPLLRKKIEIKRLILIEPEILIETDPSGRLNVMGEEPTGGSAELQKHESPSEETTLRDLFVGELRIEKGVIDYHNKQSGKACVVALEYLTLLAQGPEDAIQLWGKGAADGESFKFSGSVGSLLALTEPGRTWPVKLTLSVGTVAIGVEGEVRDPLHTGEYTFDLEASGVSSADLARMAKADGVFELGPFKASSRVVGRKERAVVESFEIELGLEQLVACKVNGRIGDLLTLRGADVTFKIYGNDLASVGEFAERPVPVGGPFELSGRVQEMAEKVYQLSELKVVADENDVSGSLKVTVHGERPDVAGTLIIQRLDLRPFLSREKDDKTPAGAWNRTSRSGRVFPAEPLSLDGLLRVDADLQINAQQIYTPRLAIDNLATVAVVDKAGISLKSLKAAIGGGSLDGRIALRSMADAVGVEAAVKVNQVDVDVVARELEFTERPGGKLDLDVNVKGEGSTVAQIMAGLSGKTLLVLSKGHINNKYLDLLGADVSNSLLRILNPLSQDTSQIVINCFVSGFEIRGGIAQSTALVMDTDRMTVVGEGTLNLKTEGLDLSFKPLPKEGVGISGVGKISLGLGELTRPFKLGGTFASPTVVFDVTQAALSLGKAVGGGLLFGPAGIAAFLAGGSPSEGNACLAAVEASKRGVKPPGGKLEQMEDAAHKTVEKVGDKTKKLFGK